jgi:hypothetical protein
MFGSGKVSSANSTIGIFFIVAVIFIAIWLFVEMYNPHTEHDVTVISKDLVTDVSGSDGDVSTSVYYLVITDKGTFKMKTQGLNQASGDIYKIEPGNKYDFEVRGIKIPFFGIYTNIITVY